MGGWVARVFSFLGYNFIFFVQKYCSEFMGNNGINIIRDETIDFWDNTLRLKHTQRTPTMYYIVSS